MSVQVKVTWIESVVAGTGIVTGINRGPIEGESVMDASPQMFVWDYISERYKVVNYLLVALTLEEKEAIEFAESKPALQETFKAECTDVILKAYPDAIQRSAALGVYPEAFKLAMVAFIADTIEEENRVNALVEDVTTPEELALVIPAWRI